MMRWRIIVKVAGFGLIVDITKTMLPKALKRKITTCREHQAYITGIWTDLKYGENQDENFDGNR